MSRLSETPLSILDLAPILEGGTAAQAFQRSLELARMGEQLGYRRFWLAEHHSMPGIASAATAVAIGFIAGGTSSIRVGSGGIMLPNHSPLIIAEQFGTLESLHPGRIDLGLGRAPGTDQVTSRVIRRGLEQKGEDFPQLLAELRAYLQTPLPGQTVRAIPGAGLDIPIWLLGSGGFSAQLAGQLGLPFASAGHFSPDNMVPGLELYRRAFRPSAALSRPFAMVGVNVIAAETDAEAQRLMTSAFQAHLSLIRGRPGQLPPPVESMEGRWSASEEAAVASFLRGSIVGSPEKVSAQLEALLEATQADELMVHAMIYDHAARLNSYRLLAELRAQPPRHRAEPPVGAES